MFDKTIEKLLNIKYPIIQGGMAWISDSSLASAVSEAGGLGVIAAGGAPGEIVRQEIIKTKQMTDKPFAVNVMLLSEFADEVAKVVIEEKVPIVITGAGSPEKYLEAWHQNNIKVIPVVPSVLLATRMEKLGVDAVVVEGMEAGGHIGELTTMALLPQVVDALKIPVIAAGGIADGRGFAAVVMLGANGVQVGTRFLVANECTVHENYKEQILKARDTDTIVTGRVTGHPVRALKNKLAREFIKLEKNGASIAELEALGVGKLQKAAKDGDVAGGALMAGQIAGLVCKKQSAKEIVEEIYNQGLEVLKKYC
ncbi:MAG: enoyl-(acyl-carrier-protein) reductase II [Fusobacteria bacterium]|nr:MAG: enoyl-(acyl-carrier-protein) reductase II [Fusobacteriota bacterium]KAF0228930.1 MAG: enoyl-(acyl-carrier-protein) reductase [Fusobacteriota bacterium]